MAAAAAAAAPNPFAYVKVEPVPAGGSFQEQIAAVTKLFNDAMNALPKPDAIEGLTKAWESKNAKLLAGTVTDNQ